MLSKHKVLILISILLIGSTILCSQVASSATEDSTSIKIIEVASQALAALLNKDYAASSYINWEVFSFNGYSYAADYWDAWEWEEEDYFIEDLIVVLSFKLKLDSAPDDKFESWTLTKDGENTIASCNDRVKIVKFTLVNDEYGPVIIALDIKPLK